MFQKKVNRYLVKKNKELEQELKKYISDESRVSDLIKNLSSLETEWTSEIEKLNNTRKEYEDLIKDVRMLWIELCNTKGVGE